MPNNFKRPVRVHEAEAALSPADPISSDRDFITFVREEANRAFRMMRAADEISAYLGRTTSELADDVLAKGVINVREAANCRSDNGRKVFDKTRDDFR